MIKTLLRKAAARVGYEIRKAPLPGFLPARIFDLVVQYVILTRGESLRFIQVGANDGRYGDPLRRYVLKYPWKGILVEPQPEVYEALKLNYAGLEDRLFFENVAISTDAGGMTLYRARNTFEREGEATRYAASVAWQRSARHFQAARAVAARSRKGGGADGASRRSGLEICFRGFRISADRYRRTRLARTSNAGPVTGSAADHSIRARPSAAQGPGKGRRASEFARLPCILWGTSVRHVSFAERCLRSLSSSSRCNPKTSVPGAQASAPNSLWHTGMSGD
jgi:hypothetical protein